MKKLFFILSIFLSVTSFGQTTVQGSISAARSYTNSNITTNGANQITGLKVNTALNRVIDAVKAVNDSIPRNAIGYLIKMTTGPNGVPKINVDSSKLDSVIRSIGGGDFNTVLQTGTNNITGFKIIQGNDNTSGLSERYYGTGKNLEIAKSPDGFSLDASNTSSNATTSIRFNPLIGNGILYNNLSTNYSNNIYSNVNGIGLNSYTSSTSNYITIVPNNSNGGFQYGNENGIRYKFPRTQPANNQILAAIDGAGTLGWVNNGGGSSTLNTKYNEETTSTGSTTITFSNAYISNTIRLYRNGVRLSPSLWTETTSTTITLTFTPNAGDKFLSDYNY